MLFQIPANAAMPLLQSACNALQSELAPAAIPAKAIWAAAASVFQVRSPGLIERLELRETDEPNPAMNASTALKAARARSAKADQSIARAISAARKPIATPIAAIAMGTAPKAATQACDGEAYDAEHATKRLHRATQHAACRSQCSEGSPEECRARRRRVSARWPGV